MGVRREPAWLSDPRAAEGAAAVLIGCGPSLARADLRLVAGLPSITFNRAYLAFDDWPFTPDYYACLDPRAAELLGAEIAEHVLARGVRAFLHPVAFAAVPSALRDRVVACEIDPDAPFAERFGRLRDMGNVGASALQILALLGFRRIVTLGVDGAYVAPAVPSADGGEPDDPNHFWPGYRRGLPRSGIARHDDVRFTAGWAPAAAFCAERGVAVINATDGGVVEAFARMPLEAAARWAASAPTIEET